VSAEVSAGVFALAGALLGGLASFGATALEARSRRGEFAEARREKITDERRLLYNDLIQKADVLADAARDVISFIRNSDVTDVVRENYIKAWAETVQARAAVDIIGPGTMASAATDLYTSVIEICNQVDQWLASGNWTDQDDQQYEANVAQRKRVRTDFVTAARALLGTQD
jgi:hypothetical protein